MTGLMAIFYRGAGVGTHWHTNDPRLSGRGFTAWAPGLQNTPDRVIQHVYQGLTHSPYVSLSLSYPVALNYALEMGRSERNRCVGSHVSIRCRSAARYERSASESK